MSGSDTTKSSRIDLRVTQQQKELLEKAAALQGISLSAYTLSHLIPIAQKEISDREKVILSDRDRDLLISALEKNYKTFKLKKDTQIPKAKPTKT
jgi:uncharacterized protein (DUF1778 family)